MWLPKIFRREHKPKITPGLKYVPTATAQSDLWWVKVILNVGRPVVAVIVLVMCAPGEHYLAKLAGWSHWLAWGMPATLTAYAGIAAVVATKRPKESPGKKTAVAGAVISVALAMGAQPIAHLYERGLIVGHQFALTVVVSCIPALVFGHLLHMAAAPVHAPREQTDGDTRDILGMEVPVHGPRSQASPGDEAAEDNDALQADMRNVGYPGPDAMRYRPEDEDEIERDTGDNASINYLRGEGPYWNGDTLRRDAQADIDRRPPDVPVSPRTGLWTAPTGTPPPDNGHVSDEAWSPVPGVTGASLSLVPDVSSVSRSRVNGTRTGTGVTGRVRTALRDNPGLTDDEIRDKFTGEDIRPNTINKSIKRIREENGSQQ